MGEENIPRTEKSKCKGPGEEKRLVYSRTTKAARAAIAQQWRVVKRNVWKVGGGQILYSKAD